MLSGARNRRAAIERHREHIQRSLGVITDAIWRYGKSPGRKSWFLVTAPDTTIELVTDQSRRLFLRAVQSFEVDRHRGNPFRGELLSGYKVRLTGYVYSIGMRPEPDRALIEWHWHPPDRSTTHVHVRVQDEYFGQMAKLHVPTSRVWFEQVVEFLIDEFHVTPTRDDWRSVLNDVRRRVEGASSWQGDRPPDTT